MSPLPGPPSSAGGSWCRGWSARPPGPATPGNRQPKPRRAAQWTAEDVSAAAGQAGEEAGAVARTVSDWAAGSYLHLAARARAIRRWQPGPIPGAPEAHATVASWSCTQARMAAARPGGPGHEDVPDVPVRDCPIERATLSCGAPLRW